MLSQRVLAKKPFMERESMAEGFVIPDVDAWARALGGLTAAEAAFDAVSDHRSPQGEATLEHLSRAQDALLDLHAPDLLGVYKKLQIIWESENGDDTESMRKLGVMGDVFRLHFTGCGSLEK